MHIRRKEFHHRAAVEISGDLLEPLPLVQAHLGRDSSLPRRYLRTNISTAATPKTCLSVMLIFDHRRTATLRLSPRRRF